MCQENKKEEDLPELNNSLDVSTRWFKDYIKKDHRKINYNTLKQHKQNKQKQNNYSMETEMGRKTTVRIIKTTN